MQNDLFMVIGVIIIGFSIPSIVSAFAEGRPPRVAAIMLLIGGGLAAIAMTQKPGGYAIADIPGAFVRVVGYFLN